MLLALPYYVRRMLRRGGYRHDFHHRFGKIDRPPKKQRGRPRVWIQAVSVGEVGALEPVVTALHTYGAEVVITTTTSTGYQLLKDTYRDKVLLTGIFPIDSCFFSSNAWRRIDPDIAVLMESELWPEHLHRARERDVPVALINARLSDKSFGRYRSLGFFTNWVFRNVDAILAATESDAERFRQIAVDPSKVVISGNIKCDIELARLDAAALRDLRKQMGFAESSFVLAGLSTWPGEEAMLIELVEDLRKKFPETDMRLLLIPRHMERRSELAARLEASSLSWHLRSREVVAPEGTVVYVADTTGEMRELMQISQLAFVGKSLPPNSGGQTPIEAAALGIAVVYGPHMTNFRYICRSLEANGGSRQVQSHAEAKAVLTKLSQDQAARASMGVAAQAWQERQRGASDRTAQKLTEMVCPYLEAPKSTDDA